jgi:hypothetical protein
MTAEHDLRTCPAMRALERLTPGGSEYVDEIERCVTHVRESRHSMMQALVDAKKQAEAREKELLEVLRYYVRNNYRTPNAPKLRKEMEARAEKLLAGEPETKEG